jgi:8-oxo-dGTP pyrophosphatase MutT (NUDIX family)
MALAEALLRHVPEDSDEAAALAAARELVERERHPFDRRLPRHLTGSAVVLSPSGARVLLVRHAVPPPWRQPGGHGEPGEEDGAKVALREAGEETGLDDLRLHPTAPRPFDVARYPVPARKAEPEHEHLDLRYLIVTEAEPVDPEPGSGDHASRWYAWAELEALGLDAGLTRALGKARRLMEQGPAR